MNLCKQLELFETKTNEIIHGDCLEEMKKMESNSVSAIITDPPYGLGFMGKKWDLGLPHKDIWVEALRICKPGSFLLAFGGSRTYHKLTCAIEDSGWEIRDCIMWIYGSGFPKSHNHFGLNGYGTALKPAYEPIIMAMKPCDGTFKQNAEKWGQAGINIDRCRIPGGAWLRDRRFDKASENLTCCYRKGIRSAQSENNPLGRWPANVIFDEESAELLDEQSGLSAPKKERKDKWSGDNVSGASRFFYCAKASSSERNKGCDELPLKSGGSNVKGYTKDVANGLDRNRPVANYHPTVKPLKLMEYLIKLIAPPKDALILDLFAGSGTTILAAQNLGIRAIGIEKEAEYVKIANARLE